MLYDIQVIYTTYLLSNLTSTNLILSPFLLKLLLIFSVFPLSGLCYRTYGLSQVLLTKNKKNLAKQQLVVKKLSETRWFSRHDAIRALAKGSVSIKESLDELAEDEEQTVQTRHDTESISDKLNALEYAFMCLF